MKILVVDIGTGTQDILLADTELDIENSFRMVVPSPTMIAHSRIKAASKAGKAIAISGVMMGGGPNFWAAKGHLELGYKIFSTNEAAKTFDDDLERVKELGIELISEDEFNKLPEEITKIKFIDFNHQAIAKAFKEFGVDFDEVQVAAIGVFDHGEAPPNYSDRQFRFDYLAERLREEASIENFSFMKNDIHARMTRMGAVARSTQGLKVPVVLMDTAPAAILGATFDKRLDDGKDKLIVNIGNMHTIAFIISDEKVISVFEHHTGKLNSESLEMLLRKFAANNVSHEDVFGHHGHGALSLKEYTYDLNDEDLELVVTGPRQNMIRKTGLNPIFAAPFGDMMLTGCYGLLAAIKRVLPMYSEEIEKLLSSSGEISKAPWDL
jgi:uncharacterized protein (DUF1786 family)